MIYRVVFSMKARADIRGVARWLNRQGSQSAAKRWYSGLIKSLKPLERLPEIHPIAEEMSDLLGFPIRECLYGKRSNVYRILFTVDADTVNVIGIRHGAQGPIES